MRGSARRLGTFRRPLPTASTKSDIGRWSAGSPVSKRNCTPFWEGSFARNASTYMQLNPRRRGHIGGMALSVEGRQGPFLRRRNWNTDFVLRNSGGGESIADRRDSRTSRPAGQGTDRKSDAGGDSGYL